MIINYRCQIELYNSKDIISSIKILDFEFLVDVWGCMGAVRDM